MMPFSRELAQSLAPLVHGLRPAWTVEGIYAALAKCQGRDAFDVSKAAIRAAQDPAARTPGVIPKPGSHWLEDTPTAPRIERQPFRRGDTCATCGQSRQECAARWATDHVFVPLTEAARDRAEAGDELRTALADVRAGLCSHGVQRIFCADHRAAVEA